MQEGTTEDNNNLPVIESVEQVETYQEEIGIQNYRPQQVSTRVLPDSNNFASLAGTVAALEDMSKLAAVLIKSNLCPLKKEEDVVLAIITGNQFGFPFMTSINNIYPINGRPSLSSHLHRAMLLQHKIVSKKIYGFEPMYDWAKVDKEGKVVFTTATINNQSTQVPVVLKRATVAEKPTEPCIQGLNEVDRITKYEFTRMFSQANGTYITMTAIGEFTMSDAAKAGLLEKDVWIKYPKRMLDARAFTNGAKEIADDITLGIPSISEMAEANNIQYTITENLEESIVR